MAPKFVTVLCYWGGKTCDGQEGAAYDKPPSKAIKVKRGIKFNVLIDQIHTATSIDKQQYKIEVICRYPAIVGKMMKYIILPVKDNDDIEIIFDVLSLHHELSCIELYLEIEANAPRTQESVLIEGSRSELLPTMIHGNVASDMNRNEDLHTVSQIPVVNNEMSSGLDDENLEEEDDLEEDVEQEEDEGPCETEVPSHFTRLEGMDMAIADSTFVSLFESKNDLTKNDLTRELGTNTFKDKEELIRAIKLYTMRKHMQYEVVESCPTIWKIRCKFCSQSGCKWQLRACKRKRSGRFEITRFTGMHTCLQDTVTQDHPNLDSSLIAQEIEHIVKEQPTISIPALKAEMIEKLGYTASYRKVWKAKQKAIERVFGNLK